VTADDRSVLRDAELIELLADEPELLALVDAYAATQQGHWPHRRIGVRVLRLGLLAAAVAIIAVPAAAFADQIGQLLGLSNSGTPVQSTAFPPRQVSALERIRFPTGQVRLLAARAGIGFYSAKTTSGDYCFAVGLTSEATPRIDALNCPGEGLSPFPSSSDPVADFSRLDARNGITYVTTFAGFATDSIATVSIEAADGKTIYSAPVIQNVYAARDLPHMPAVSIVAMDHLGHVLFRKSLAAPPQPQPAIP
jgi:hypothetical protein